MPTVKEVFQESPQEQGVGGGGVNKDSNLPRNEPYVSAAHG